MSDFWPHGDVARTYGVLSSRGFSERAIFLIDKKGVIRYIEVVRPIDMPSTEELFNALKLVYDEQKDLGRSDGPF
jgi:peroxiredoxin (alkyl hydroperoxide reductase subunit C)